MLKRIIDIVGSAAGLVALAPLFAVVAGAVKLTSEGPVFYRQVRLARGGREFRIFKFRSMVDGAERRGARITRAGDDRVTPVGRFLRRHKLDELPQLINVLVGDMSLVGPRPEVPEFIAHYPAEFARVLTVRPGVTHRATQLFRNEEELLGRAAEPRTFYVERILPRKLAIYLADLDRTSALDDLRTILDTIFNRSAAIELEFVAGNAQPERGVAAGGWSGAGIGAGAPAGTTANAPAAAASARLAAARRTAAGSLR
ncbi:MAG: sugar transferase [Candidatus Krumholzibacteriia bacterium]